METDMRNEFESYVKKLTTAICKDILLEKMEELYSKYDTEYEKYSEATKQAISASQLVQERVQTADLSIKKIEKLSEASLKKLSNDIHKMEINTQSMFDEMRALNFKNINDFIIEFSEYIEEYKEDVAETFDNGCRQISDKLAGVITAEKMQQFLNSLEENTRETKEIAVFINETYKNEIEQNVKSIIERNKSAQDEINESISDYVKRIMNNLEEVSQNTDASICKRAQDFSDVTNRQMNVFAKYLTKLSQDEKQKRDEALKCQMELIKQIGPSDEKINQFEKRVVALEEMIRNMEKENNANNQRLQDTLKRYIWEQKELEIKRHADMDAIQKSADNISWKLYMGSSNTLMLALFVLLIIFQKPWEVWGIKYSFIVVGVYIVIMFFGAFIRNAVAKGIAKRKERKLEKLYR